MKFFHPVGYSCRLVSLISALVNFSLHLFKTPCKPVILWHGIVPRHKSVLPIIALNPLATEPLYTVRMVRKREGIIEKFPMSVAPMSW